MLLIGIHAYMYGEE
jgi:hypothetical protein